MSSSEEKEEEVPRCLECGKELKDPITIAHGYCSAECCIGEYDVPF